MTRDEISRIIEQVTKEVLSEGTAGGFRGDDGACENRVLFICRGGRELPYSLAVGAEVCDIQDYEACQDISCFRRVVIGHLSMVHLADIALARMADPISCAVLHALLNGTEVLLLDGTLPFQQFKGKGSPALYKQLNEYVHKLQIYGIKLYIDREVKKVEVQTGSVHDAQEVPVSWQTKRSISASQLGSARPNAAHVLTEADAVALIAALRPDETLIRLDPGTILTPSARDVFLRNRIEVI
ncbi:MAG: hypothetical protein IKE31_08800 [Eubacterium sp.]|nr:hypothetical protein [Eubacterium sp.]